MQLDFIHRCGWWRVWCNCGTTRLLLNIPPIVNTRTQSVFKQITWADSPISWFQYSTSKQLKSVNKLTIIGAFQSRNHVKRPSIFLQTLDGNQHRNTPQHRSKYTVNPKCIPSLVWLAALSYIGSVIYKKKYLLGIYRKLHSTSLALANRFTGEQRRTH